VRQSLQKKVVASITASATPGPAVPGKSTAAPAEKDVAGLSQTLNSPDRSVSRYDFFIAYATPDRQQAQNLCWFLQDDACKVFLDVQNLELGVSWGPALREALEASRAIVVLVSTHADNAFYQQEEIGRAIQLARDMPQAYTVIPVILEKLPQSTVIMPYGISSLQAQDATRAGGLKRVAAELVAWLNYHQRDVM
jgi:TIR domain